MHIARDQLFKTMGIGQDFAQGHSLILESEDGAWRAMVRWNQDGLTADVAEQIADETSDVVITIEGTFISEDDCFDIAAEDRRHAVSDPKDALSVASAFRSLTADMAPLSSSVVG